MEQGGTEASGRIAEFAQVEEAAGVDVEAGMYTAPADIGE